MDTYLKQEDRNEISSERSGVLEGKTTMPIRRPHRSRAFTRDVRRMVRSLFSAGPPIAIGISDSVPGIPSVRGE
jgi:hypothetical protein